MKESRIRRIGNWGLAVPAEDSVLHELLAQRDGLYVMSDTVVIIKQLKRESHPAHLRPTS